MKQLERLIERIIKRVNVNLREFDFDVTPYIHNMISLNNLLKFYAFYGITSDHPIHFHFSNSNLAGSYFLGQCKVDNAILYKCDIRGDELKEKGAVFPLKTMNITVDDDEVIWIKDSFLIKTLVHNYSHNPENLELFLIKNTISGSYANIHGSPVSGCLIGPFSTVDLSVLHNCIVGAYSYLQVGELTDQQIESGRIWVRAKDLFDFDYCFPQDALRKYIAFDPEKGMMGMFTDFAEDRKEDFQKIFDVVHLEPLPDIPHGTSLNRYAVLAGENRIGENVLVSQRAYLEDVWLGKGANAQENCCISHSRLDGFNVTAHGATIIYAHLKKKVFVGFNSFLMGSLKHPLTIGENSIVMPHTIIDVKEPMEIPPAHLVWGLIRTSDDLKKNSIPFHLLSEIKDRTVVGNMTFHGDGAAFVHAFQHRIEHILEANGAYFDGEKNRGHAQKGQNISFNIIQPYPKGTSEGLFPSIDIQP